MFNLFVNAMPLVLGRGAGVKPLTGSTSALKSPLFLDILTSVAKAIRIAWISSSHAGESQMPYFNFFDQDQDDYEPANGQFSPDDLEPDSRQVFEILRGLGVQSVYCSYNGGYDEGFAHLDAVELGDRRLELNELKYQLATGVLGSKTSDDLQNYYFNREPSPDQRVEFYLESFASELAISLLGSNYGTGEFSIRGSFRANLLTREIMDEQE
jgi:hypothetical protein